MDKQRMQEVIVSYRGDQTLRAFAQGLSSVTPLTAQAVKNWCSGASIPSLETLAAMLENTEPGAWQRHMALDLLRLALPSVAITDR